MDRRHPSADHWYLPLTGVDVVAQGRGLGTALLRHTLQSCDRDRLPAYLEATSPRSRDLYQRYGFEVIGEIRAGIDTAHVGDASRARNWASRVLTP